MAKQLAIILIYPSSSLVPLSLNLAVLFILYQYHLNLLLIYFYLSLETSTSPLTQINHSNYSCDASVFPLVLHI